MLFLPYQDLQQFDGNFSIDYRIDLWHYFVNAIEIYRLIYVLQLDDWFVRYIFFQETKYPNKFKEIKKNR